MTRDTKLALGAAAVAAAIEYPLGQKFPLAQPVAITTRMAVAGGLAFASVLVAAYFVKE
jgi:hypothetical protein